MLNALVVVVSDQIHIAKVLMSVFSQAFILLGDGGSDLCDVLLIFSLSLRHFLSTKTSNDHFLCLFIVIFFLVWSLSFLCSISFSLVLSRLSKCFQIFIESLLGNIHSSNLLAYKLFETETVSHLVLNFMFDYGKNVLHIHNSII